MRQGISAANYQRSRSRTRPRGSEKPLEQPPRRPQKERAEKTRAALEAVNRKARHYESSETSDERPLRSTHSSSHSNSNSVRVAQYQHQQQQERQQRLAALDRAAAEVAIRRFVTQLDDCFIAWRDLAHASWFRRMWLQFKAMKSLHEFVQRSKLYASIRERELQWLQEAMGHWHRVANNNRKQQEDIYSADTVRYIYLGSYGLRALQAYPRRRDAVLTKLEGRDPLALMIYSAQARGFTNLREHAIEKRQQREQCRTSIRHYYSVFLRKWRAAITMHPSTRLQYRTAVRAANARTFQKGFLTWLQYVCNRLNIADQDTQATQFLRAHRLKHLFDRFQTSVVRSFKSRADDEGVVDWFAEKHERAALVQWFNFTESQRPPAPTGRTARRLALSPRQTRRQLKQEAFAVRHQWDDLLLKKRYVFRWYVNILQSVSEEDHALRVQHCLHKWSRWVSARKLERMRSQRRTAIGVRSRDRAQFVTQKNPAHPYNDVVKSVQLLTEKNTRRRVFQALVLVYLGRLLQNRTDWNSIASRFYDWKAACDAIWFHKWYAKHKAVGNLLWNARRRALCREQSHLGTTACIHLALSNGFEQFARNIQARRKRRIWRQQQQQQEERRHRMQQASMGTPTTQPSANSLSGLHSARRRLREQLTPSSRRAPSMPQTQNHQGSEPQTHQSEFVAAHAAAQETQGYSNTPQQQPQQLPVDTQAQQFRRQHLSMQRPEQPSGPAQVGTPRLFSWRNASSTSSRSLQGEPPSRPQAESNASVPRSAPSVAHSVRFSTPETTTRDSSWDVL